MREDWVNPKLGELSVYQIGGDWGKEPSFEDLEYIEVFCIRGTEFRDWKTHKAKTAVLRKIKIGSLANRQLKLNDILVEISGGGPDQPVGRTQLIDKTVIKNFANKNLIHTNFLRLLRPSIFINATFLDLYLKFFYSTGEIINYQAGSNNLRNLKFDKFLTIEIPCCSFPEQRAIVKKLESLFSSLDASVADLKKAQAQLKIYRQALLEMAFEGKLTGDNIECFEPIGTLADFNPKIKKEDVSTGLECQFVPMKLVEEQINKINLSETKKYSELQGKSYTYFQNDDVIFAKVTPCMENGKAAVAKNLKNNIAFGSSEFHVLRCSEKLHPEYLFHFLIREKFRKEAEQAMTGAVGLRRVPKKFIWDYIIPMPPPDKQIKIVREIESRLSICDAVEKQIKESLTKAEALRQSILKKAFEGKLLTEAEIEACKQEPDYEPAAVLLEKIKAEKAAAAKNKKAKA